MAMHQQKDHYPLVSVTHSLPSGSLPEATPTLYQAYLTWRQIYNYKAILVLLVRPFT